MRRRDGGWRAYTTRGTPQPSQFRGAVTHTHAPVPFRSFSLDALDDSAKRVMAMAQDEAIRMNHNYIGTEHLLLGLIRGDADGPAGRALARLGVSLDKARTALQFIIGRGDTTTSPAELTMSPRTRKVLELATAEAATSGKPMTGATEILLGLVREGEGIASGIIESLGITLEAMRQAVLDEMAGVPPRPTPGAQAGRPAPTPSYHGPFDRFNDRAKRTLALAQDEAIRFNHNYMGPEHLLLGLVREGEGVAARALHALGVEVSPTRRVVEQLIGRGEGTSSPSEITLTPRTKKVIELAIDEARILAHGHVGTEHLLLGLIRDDGSNATQVLTAQGVVLSDVRKKVIELLAGGGAPPGG